MKPLFSVRSVSFLKSLISKPKKEDKMIRYHCDEPGCDWWIIYRESTEHYAKLQIAGHHHEKHLTKKKS
jgi:hypothetical protein